MSGDDDEEDQSGVGPIPLCPSGALWILPRWL